MIVQTASEALARYQDFLARDALVQRSDFAISGAMLAELDALALRGEIDAK